MLIKSLLFHDFFPPTKYGLCFITIDIRLCLVTPGTTVQPTLMEHSAMTRFALEVNALHLTAMKEFALG